MVIYEILYTEVYISRTSAFLRHGWRNYEVRDIMSYKKTSYYIRRLLNMKHSFRHLSTFIFILSLICGCLLLSSRAAAQTYYIYDNCYGGSCSAVVSKNKVYFSTTETGKIQCYNIKSGKTTTVIKKNGKGFYSMKKKGGYLYAIYDSYGGSDGSNDSIVRVNIKTGKMETLAKGCNFVIQNKIIYYTMTERTRDEYDNDYDKEIGVYSMNLDGSNQTACSDVTLSTKQPKKIKTSKGTLISSGKTYSDGYYSPYKLTFKPKNGKKKVLYNVKKDKNAAEYSSIWYFTIQGNYVIFKTYLKGGEYSPDGALVIMKTNGKGKKVFYKRTSVSGW